MAAGALVCTEYDGYVRRLDEAGAHVDLVDRLFGDETRGVHDAAPFRAAGLKAGDAFVMRTLKDDWGVRLEIEREVQVV